MPIPNMDKKVLAETSEVFNSQMKNGASVWNHKFTDAIEHWENIVLLIPLHGCMAVKAINRDLL